MIYLMTFFSIALTVIIDQIIKYFVVLNLKPVGTMEVIPNIFNLTYVENRGVAFGMFKNLPWLFILITAVFIFCLLFFTFKFKIKSKLCLASVILICGGGIGNMIDRIINHYVVDYLSLSFFPPVCNFADYCVTVGCVLLLIYIIFLSDFFKNEKKA
ncbi:MAG: signal peptidase II [Acutalibacteraceae bacterium]